MQRMPAWRLLRTACNGSVKGNTLVWLLASPFLIIYKQGQGSGAFNVLCSSFKCIQMFSIQLFMFARIMQFGTYISIICIYIVKFFNNNLHSFKSVGSFDNNQNGPFNLGGDPPCRSIDQGWGLAMPINQSKHVRTSIRVFYLS